MSVGEGVTAVLREHHGWADATFTVLQTCNQIVWVYGNTLADALAASFQL